VSDPSVPGDTLVDAAVRALRAGDRASLSTRGRTVAGPRGGSTRTGTVETLELLTQALEEGRPVWIGYVDGHGGVVERVVDPIRLQGGYLTAYDHRYEAVHTFAVHRITGVAELAADEA
jgi:predicted DNA-binding transcriptional regulator YafY